VIPAQRMVMLLLLMGIKVLHYLGNNLLKCRGKGHWTSLPCVVIQLNPATWNLELFFNEGICKKTRLTVYYVITNSGLYTPAPDSPRSLKSSGSGRAKRSPKFPRYLFLSLDGLLHDSSFSANYFFHSNLLVIKVNNGNKSFVIIDRLVRLD